MNERVVGYSPEIIALLRQLQNRIGIMLQMTPSSLPSGDGAGTGIINPRFDIIIGNVGIKDLSNVPNPDWIDAPEPVLGLLPEEAGKTVAIIHKKSSSLSGTGQWPNVAKEPVLSDADDLALKWIEEYGRILRFQEEILAEAAFRAGYKEGRRRLDRP